MVLLSLIGFLISALSIVWIIRWAARHASAYGEAMPQRFHVGEVPRLGGVAVLLGMLGSWLAGVVLSAHGDPGSVRLGPWVAGWALAIAPAAIGGITEDVTQRLAVRYRLLLTLSSAALATALLGLEINRLGLPFLDSTFLRLPWFGTVLVLLAIAGLPHAFNIIDGYNGLAGMVALIVCLALLHVCLQAGDRPLAALLICVAAATAGFLVWNYPRGMIFAGDGGAYVWGTVIAIASIALVQRNPDISPWFPLLLLMYPVWETLFSIYRKIIRGGSPGVADALHLHQLIYRRLVRGVFHEDEARRMLKRNNRTAPYLWAFFMLTVVPAVLLRNNTPALIACCLLFCVAYVATYFCIVRFKVPPWVRF